MTDLFSVTLEEQIHEVRYELSQRARVYPRLVRRGRMHQSTADQHVRRMEAVLQTLERLKAADADGR